MEIALVTNQENHHKFWASKLNEVFNVSLIIIPTPVETKHKILATKIFKYGIAYSLLKIASIIYHKISSKSFSKKLIHYENLYFNEYANAFENELNNKTIFVDTVNSESVVNIIQNKKIDLICFLGGDIARKEFISAANIGVLNFHSGLSPFYNGNKTIFQAFSDFRPNFAGGTLMYMNERIDGGKIISHYIVPIDSDDCAASVFMKNIVGSTKLYIDAINQMIKGNLPIGVKQSRSLKYFRNIDWTIINDIRLRYFEESGNIKNYLRPEQIIKYYSGEDDHSFSRLLKILLMK